MEGENLQELLWGENPDPLVRSQPQKMLIAGHNVLGASFHRTLEVPVIRWVFRDHFERAFSWRQDGQMSEILDEQPDFRWRPPVVSGNLRIIKNPADLFQDRRGDF